MGWKAFAQCGIYMVEYEMLENSSGYTDKYKICKSITYKEGIISGGIWGENKNEKFKEK